MRGISQPEEWNDGMADQKKESKHYSARKEIVIKYYIIAKINNSVLLLFHISYYDNLLHYNIFMSSTCLK